MQTVLISILFYLITDLINLAIEQEVLYVNELTSYVADISDKHHRYNSLLFQSDGIIFKSAETTKEIMNRFFEFCNTDYKILQKMGKTIGITRKCPYVKGVISFAPDRGVSKRNANWIGFHNVDYIHERGQHTLLKIGFHNELILPLPKNQIESMINHICLLSQFERSMFEEWKASFRYTLRKDKQLNIIEKSLRDWSYLNDFPTGVEFYNKLVNLKSLDILNETFGEENPRTQDMKSIFPSYYGKDVDII